MKIKEKIEKYLAKFERGFAELLEFPFKGILNSFILAIVVIIAILLIAYLRGSYGAVMPQANNVPLKVSKTAGSGQYYRREAQEIYKKVYKLDKAVQALGQPKKLKVNSGYSPSKPRKINKLDKKTQKNEKN
ncbi:MAG: hypothetical protein M0016_00240 [Deltaproteobacteria bacterium]|jgi:hypothetical protein|nr:hypothetical protein [Deltaproteobacteria bacterium]MCL5880943.1 hypothetical protein [Deltaproteobacteria bacterium]MDA8303589.1 hypothetical protein [Deltaproteobacteria bacterium]